MAAYGSGAVARSIRDNVTVMNVDIGGGTSKIAVCADGKVIDLTAVDVGARLVCLDDAGKIVRIEEAGRRFAAELGITLELGATLSPEQARALASRMADRLFEAMHGGSPIVDGSGLCRLDPLKPGAHHHRGHVLRRRVGIHLRPRDAVLRRSRPAAGAGNPRAHRRLGPGARTLDRGHPRHRGRRLAIHHAGLSGSTIYVSPMETLPLRNVPVIAPTLPLDGEVIDSAAVAAAIKGVLRRLDLGDGDSPVAVFVPWRGSATFQRLDAFCKGAVDGLADVLAKGHPLVLAGDGDVGGLLGIHLREEMKIEQRHRLDRRARAQGFRLHRHRHHAAGLGRGAGRDQVADLPDLRRHRQGMAAGAARGRRSRGGIALDR